MDENKFLGKKTNSNNIKLEEIKEKIDDKEELESENNGKIPYFCALCGHKVILSSISFDSLPHRRVDDAIICLLKDNNIENLLVKDKYMVIRRGKNRYEKQKEACCNEEAAVLSDGDCRPLRRVAASRRRRRFPDAVRREERKKRHRHRQRQKPVYHLRPAAGAL